MASGTITKAVGSYWRLRLTWSSTANASNNTSTVTTNLYWESTSSTSGVSSSSPKTATTTVNGSSRDESFTAGISGNQSKLIQTESWTVAHNQNGSKSISIGFSANLALTLGGTYYGTVSNSQTVNLDTIASASTGSIEPWNFPSNTTYSIVRGGSNSYTHTIQVQLSYGDNEPQIVAERTGIGAGDFTLSFTINEKKEIANYLRKNLTYYSSQAKLIVKTYNGSTLVGTYTTPTTSIVTSSLSTEASVTPTPAKVSDSITVDLSSRADSTFIHLVELSTSSSYPVGTLAQKVVEGDSTTFSLSDFRSEILDHLGTELSGDLYIRVHTFYNSMESSTNVSTNKIRSMRVTSFTVSENNPPIFGTGSLTYQDSNTATSNITGSNQILVKGKSTAVISIPVSARATAQDGATISTYTLSLGSNTQTWPAASIPTSVSIPITTLSSTTNAVLTATDSRGLSSSRFLSIIIRDYYAQAISTKTAVRSDMDSTSVQLSIGGYFSTIGGTNSIVNAKWGLTSTTVTNDMVVSFNSNTGLWSATATTSLPDANTQTYHFTVVDKFGTSVSGTATAPKTSPILYIDSENASLGIGKIPAANVALDVNGVLSTVGPGNIMSAPVGHSTNPVLRVKGYTDHAVLALDSHSSNYSTRLSLMSLGSEDGYLERYYSDSSIRLHASRMLRLSSMADSIVLASNTEIDAELNVTEDVTVQTISVSRFQGKAIQVLKVSITVTAANTPTGVPVTWPIPFDSAPIVQCTAQSIAPQTAFVSASGISNEGATIYLTRPASTSAVTVHVMAIEP